jgi:hypothetical protein
MPLKNPAVALTQVALTCYQNVAVYILSPRAPAVVSTTSARLTGLIADQQASTGHCPSWEIGACTGCALCVCVCVCVYVSCVYVYVSCVCVTTLLAAVWSLQMRSATGCSSSSPTVPKVAGWSASLWAPHLSSWAASWQQHTTNTTGAAAGRERAVLGTGVPLKGLRGSAGLTAVASWAEPGVFV